MQKLHGAHLRQAQVAAADRECRSQVSEDQFQAGFLWRAHDQRLRHRTDCVRKQAGRNIPVEACLHLCCHVQLSLKSSEHDLSLQQWKMPQRIAQLPKDIWCSAMKCIPTIT